MIDSNWIAGLAGKWEGSVKTWFQPGVLADESTVSGEFVPVLGGKLVRHVYTGSMQGNFREGEELIALNVATGGVQVSWFDSFHMSGGILFSEGEPGDAGFSVTGAYDVAPTERPWGWRTEYDLAGDGTLTITAFNITPDGEEAKAVETVYVRSE